MDVMISLILFIISPLLAFFIRHPSRMIKNLIFVLTGKYTLIGYHGKTDEESDNLPYLKKGILSPVDALKNKTHEKGIVEKVNLLYAKDYRILNDLNILLKGFRNLGRKIV
jgi:hypothetical protein